MDNPRAVPIFQIEILFLARLPDAWCSSWHGGNGLAIAGFGLYQPFILFFENVKNDGHENVLVVLQIYLIVYNVAQ
jgi:hypothetical protein